ncbi:hypothetical protein HBB16_08500 [Pseudonocardia sp. MCCB 268]|nr:hypothetical protein [Pseudonocardia cytotoxica]
MGPAAPHPVAGTVVPAYPCREASTGRLPIVHRNVAPGVPTCSGPGRGPARRTMTGCHRPVEPGASGTPGGPHPVDTLTVLVRNRPPRSTPRPTPRRPARSPCS